jgi:hypothetical protein
LEYDDDVTRFGKPCEIYACGGSVDRQLIHDDDRGLGIGTVRDCLNHVQIDAGFTPDGERLNPITVALFLLHQSHWWRRAGFGDDGCGLANLRQYPGLNRVLRRSLAVQQLDRFTVQRNGDLPRRRGD